MASPKRMNVSFVGRIPPALSRLYGEAMNRQRHGGPGMSLATIALLLVGCSSTRNAVSKDSAPADSLPKKVDSTAPTSATTVASPTASKIDWADITAKDVDAVISGYQQNHPGVLDDKNPGFSVLLAKAAKQGGESAKKVTTGAGHEATLNQLFTNFQDYHSYWFVNEADGDGAKTAAPKKWPGFVVSLRLDRVIVTHVDAKRTDVPPVGAVLDSCNGMRTEELLKTRIGQFYGNASVPSDMVKASRFLAINDGNPLIPELTECVFSETSVSKPYRLVWSEQTAEASRFFVEAAGGMVDKASLNFDEGIAWIAFPSFDGDFSKLTGEIQARIEEIRTSKAIVLDLRGNGGGSSEWGYQVASALWGAEFVASQTFTGAFPEWRTSADTLKFWEEVIPQLPPDVQESVKPIADAFRANAPNADTKLWAQPVDQKPPVAKTLFPKLPVWVLQDTACGSACLDTMDVFKAMPNVKFIGQTTNADTNYLEVRYVDLPSGLGKYSLPMKVWRNRPRESGQSYTPDIVNTEMDWSESAVRAWARRTITAAG
jgi:Peptidase family S41